MAEEKPTKIFQDANYECARCGTPVTGKELAGLPWPRCINCGYKVFRKVGRTPTRTLKAE